MGRTNLEMGMSRKVDGGAGDKVRKGADVFYGDAHEAWALCEFFFFFCFFGTWTGCGPDSSEYRNSRCSFTLL